MHRGGLLAKYEQSATLEAESRP